MGCEGCECQGSLLQKWFTTPLGGPVVPEVYIMSAFEVGGWDGKDSRNREQSEDDMDDAEEVASS